MLLTTNFRGNIKKSVVETPIIVEFMKRMRGRARWVPHNFNPGDALTKLKGTHLEPMMTMLKSSMYHLKTEEVNLAERAAEKEATGKKARIKQSRRLVVPNVNRGKQIRRTGRFRTSSQTPAPPPSSTTGRR